MAEAVKRLIAVTSSGATAIVTKEDAGVSSFVFDRLYVKPMRTGDTTAAHALLGRLNTERADRFVEVRVESETYRVADTGIVMTANPAIVYRLGAASAP